MFLNYGRQALDISRGLLQLPTFGLRLCLQGSYYFSKFESGHCGHIVEKLPLNIQIVGLP